MIRSTDVVERTGSARLWVLTGCAVILLGSGKADAQPESPIALSGFSTSETFDVEDGKPLARDDEYLIRLLYRINQTTIANLEKYSAFNRDASVQNVRGEPRRYRFQVFHLTGRAKRVEAVPLTEDFADTSFTGYQLIKMFIEDQGTVFLATPSIPRDWPLGLDIDQPISCFGFFHSMAKFGRELTGSIGTKLSHAGTEPVFVVSRPAWFPDRPGSGVSPSHVFLASRGVDIGQLDLVRKHNNQAISEADAAAFFQFLGAADSIKTKQLAIETIGFRELLSQSSKHYGDAVRLNGHVRRAVRVYIDRRRVREQLGMDHYYELDMFIPLGNERVVVKPRSSDGQQADADDIVYENRFPATVCVTRLPGGTDQIRGKRITVDGFFLRFWNYESDYTERQHPDAGQISPLVIGTVPIIDTSSRAAIDQVMLGWFILVVGGCVGLAWYFWRSDRRAKRFDQSQQELPATISVPPVELPDSAILSDPHDD